MIRVIVMLLDRSASTTKPSAANVKASERDKPKYMTKRKTCFLALFIFHVLSHQSVQVYKREDEDPYNIKGKSQYKPIINTLRAVIGVNPRLTN